MHINEKLCHKDDISAWLLTFEREYTSGSYLVKRWGQQALWSKYWIGPKYTEMDLRLINFWTVDHRKFVYCEQVEPSKLFSKNRVGLKGTHSSPWLITFERLHMGSSYVMKRWGTPSALRPIIGRTYKINWVDLITDMRRMVVRNRVSMKSWPPCR